MKASQQFWQEIRNACENRSERFAVAIWWWTTPPYRDGTFLLNERGGMVGFPLREVALRMSHLGPAYRNGKGRPFHPWELQHEIIYPGVADTFAVIQGLTLATEERTALIEAIAELCRQKRRYRKKPRKLDEVDEQAQVA